MSIEVSVIIPTRDRWHLVARAVASARAQLGVATEIIVVDDGSRTPPPPELGFCGDFRIVPSPGHGVAAARNAGAAAAGGAWLAFLDDDDVWAPDKLQRQLAAAGDAGADFVYGSAVKVDDRLSPLVLVQAPEPATLATALIVANAVPAGASNVVVRAESFRRLGGFDERFHHLADWDLWLRLASSGVAAAVDETVVAYVQHAGNMVAGRPWSIFAEYDQLRIKHRHLASRLNRQFRPDDLIAWVAGRHALAGNPWRAATWWLAAALRYGRVGLIGRRVLRAARETRSRSGPAPAVVNGMSWLSDSAEPPRT